MSEDPLTADPTTWPLYWRRRRELAMAEAAVWAALAEHPLIRWCKPWVKLLTHRELDAYWRASQVSSEMRELFSVTVTTQEITEAQR